ncbi:YfhO family protein [Gimesia algae]|uniref:Bacterial membrane protein YfhO n=1 Tax=Gimesia algae TaxID=2527971 RepID=A0A517V8Q4_9PLAN|nr:YfhO family protein [Gimesia algae]QDT89380.1 Bacterial membrane protein YfhO [Gimesia algae]
MKSGLFQNLIAALVLLVVTGVCFQTLLSHPDDVLVGIQNHGYNDTTSQFIAFKSYQKICWEQFQQLPYWNPYSLLGMPWLGTPQSSLFYPGNWLFFFVNAVTAISWSMVLHHWWAGLGAYLLGRKYQLSFFSALLSGIVFLAAPYFVAKTGEGHFTSITQIAWFPWILYGYQLLREGSRKAVPLLAILISLSFFCGHVQELYYLLLFLSGALTIECLVDLMLQKRQVPPDPQEPAADLPGSQSTTNTPGTRFKNWILVSLFVTGLVAIDLIPVFIYTKQAVRASGIDMAALYKGSLNLYSLLQLIDPFVWGGPDQYYGTGFFYWEAVCSFGCLPLLLALWGACIFCRNRNVIRLTLFCLAALLLAFGPHLPFYTLCYQLIPGFSMFRLPARLLWICSLAVALLAGFGCETLIRLSESERKKIYRLIIGVFFAVALLGMGYQFVRSNGIIAFNMGTEQTFRIQLAWLFTAISAGFISLFLASFTRKTAIAGTLFLGLICTWELCAHSHQILQTVPQNSFRGETKLITFLKKNLGQHRVLVNQRLLSDREAWQHQIMKIQGYEPVPLVRLGLLAAAAFPQPDAAPMMAGFESPDLLIARKPLLDLMSIKYVILQTDQEPEIEGWKAIERGMLPEEFVMRNTQTQQLPYLILENLNPLPRAYITGSVSQFDPNQPSQKIVAAISKVQPRNEVLLQQDVLPRGDRQTFTAAHISNVTPNQLTIEASLTAPGYLVVSDIYYPGWTARIDNQELPVLPADYSLRAIPLPAGKHQVELSFMPPGFQIGRLISLTTLMLLLVQLLSAFRKPRSKQIT